MAGRTSVALLSFALAVSLWVTDGTAESTQEFRSERLQLNASETCQSCIEAIGHVASSGTLAMVQNNLKAQERQQIKQTCDKLRKDEREKCQEDIQELHKSMYSGLAKLNVNASSICLDARFCGPGATAAIEDFTEAFGHTSSGQAMLPNSSDTTCPMCNFMLNQSLAYLKDERTEHRFFTEAHKVCEAFSGEDQVECVTTIDKIGSLTLSLVRDISPEAACHLAQSCAPNAEFPRQLVTPQRIKTGFVEWLNHTSLEAASSGDQCDFCQMLVSEAVDLLGNPVTQTQLIADMKEMCSLFNTFGDRCISYVQMYGPMAIMTGLGYLQFNTVCSDAGFCSLPAGPAQLNLEQQTFKALQDPIT